MSTLGKNIKLTIFGESHGPFIGCTLEGIGAGQLINEDYIRNELSLRAPIKGESMRVEPDEFMIISGMFDGYTTGKPITILIPNEDAVSTDYDNLFGVPRPGSADFVNFMKSYGHYDFFGGGHSSGRISAAIVSGAAIVRQILEEKGINIFSHITKMGSFVDDTEIDYQDLDSQYEEVRDLLIPILNGDIEGYNQVLDDARISNDSIGGEIETVIYGVPLGLGESWFDSLQGKIAQAVMSISGVKGIEFGDGFKMASMHGSETNDTLKVVNGDFIAVSNHNGGISGGISNGNPIVFRTVCKPTPSIKQEQDTINVLEQKNIKIKLNGRFDPSITRKVCAVINAVSVIVIADEVVGRFGSCDFIDLDVDEDEE